MVIPPDNQNIFPIPLLCILMLHNNGHQAIFVFMTYPIFQSLFSEKWMVGQAQRIPKICDVRSKYFGEFPCVPRQ